MQDKTTWVLEVSASGRTAGSASRELTRDLIAALQDRHGNVQTVRRDLSEGVPFVDAAWIEANFTPDESRTNGHREALALSDALVAELKNADILVIGVPIYNFSIPAALKAWIDMIARARLTFRYTENGPKGLLEGKKTYLVVATGGVPVGSAVDFATPYLKHALAFIGITDVEVIAADKLNSQAEESMDAARARIADLVHLAPQAA
ncbi:MAG: NAD(P)H-dependent oxidoreductase [Gammaproteobacteria bacterium]|nr:NAD(P)H-dependent oxidoreductase [Gammaproteobacteria bacterium]MDH3577829.1 NAD(P)H-dependent oxidoreductase [Gammaproteobacteria bacterium]